MAGNRKAAEQVLFKQLALLDKSGRNLAYYKEELAKLDDTQFDQWIQGLEREDFFVHLAVPNFEGQGLTYEELLAAGDKLGHSFFERLWLTDRSTGQTYLTPYEYMVIVITLRRQSQSLMTKMSVAPDNSHIDTLSGQPTGESKTSRLSFIEMQFLRNQGMDRAVEELMKARSDIRALNILDNQIIVSGSGSLDAPGLDDVRVKSVDTLASFLQAAHLDNTLRKDGKG